MRRVHHWWEESTSCGEYIIEGDTSLVCVEYTMVWIQHKFMDTGIRYLVNRINRLHILYGVHLWVG
jgi:hypothetical protein